MLGDHADATGGQSLAFAIQQGVTARATTLPGPLIMVRFRREGDVFDAWRPGAPGEVTGWRALVRGTAAELTAAGLRVVPAHLELSRDVPPGGALGASTGLAAAVALALLALGGDEDADRLTVARVCARVAERWGGAPGGFPVPYASLMATEGHALRVDASAGTVEAVPFGLDGWSLALAPARAAATPSGPFPLGPRDDAPGERDRVEAAVTAMRARDLHALAAVLDASHADRRARLDGAAEELDRTVARC